METTPKAKMNVKLCNERMFEEETMSEVKSLLRNIQRPFKEKNCVRQSSAPLLVRLMVAAAVSAI